MKEENITFEACKGVFYNPNMTFCRSIASLAVAATNQQLVVCDAFAATGIRGLRYAVENKNVKKTIFVDIEKSATACIKKNAKKAKIKHEVVQGNISRLVFDIAADFVEVDPFGSPSPYLYDVFRMFNPLKSGYLSATATDTAVLCGGKIKASMKIYHSRPLNNEFTHETGLRILIKKIAEVAAEFNMGIEPLFSISDRHYLKTIMKVTRSADAADDSLNKLGYIEYCKKCGFRSAVKFPCSSCEQCRATTDFAGPLWLGELHNLDFLKKMELLNKQRDYSQKAEIGNKLKLMQGEIGMPPYFFDIHQLCKRYSADFLPKMDEIVDAINKTGHKAVRTHFSHTAIKTNASYAIILDVLKKLRK